MIFQAVCKAYCTWSWYPDIGKGMSCQIPFGAHLPTACLKQEHYFHREIEIMPWDFRFILLWTAKSQALPFECYPHPRQDLLSGWPGIPAWMPFHSPQKTTCPLLAGWLAEWGGFLAAWEAPLNIKVQAKAAVLATCFGNTWTWERQVWAEDVEWEQPVWVLFWLSSYA